MAKSINTYNIIRSLTYEDIKKLDYDSLYSLTKSATKMATNRQKNMLEYMNTIGLEKTPAMREPDSQHKQSKSKVAKTEKEFQGFQTYDFSLNKKDIGNINYLRYKLNMARRYIQTKTSTKYGFNKMLDKFSNKIEKEFNINIDKEFLLNDNKYDMLWRLFRELKETSSPTTNLTSGEMQKIVYETMEQNKNISEFSDLFEIIREKESKSYEESKSVEDLDDELDNQIFSKGKKNKNYGHRTHKI